ncbi:hypothetical protein [Pseudomonas sp. SLFW]|uniref:hypothetical protein n=1 Tax=Pseudomonas sp. SLFW TaxID=2683259 RepID=UPI001411E19C|nr:hypothetical protein [Pseudomonas sp. SLFW]NBB11776.1 hypothetical protein [Pseudomonas sp. SLFW]
MEKSNARNHHYISQVEQRLNAIDRSVIQHNQRIYKFKIVDAENKLVALTDINGVKIEKNLAARDLYALRMLEGGGQQNLEAAFHQYENDIGLVTQSLLQKLQNPSEVDIKSEFLKLYLLKLMNSFRNPYSIRNTLNSLQALKGVLPGNQALANQFLKMDEGQRTQASRICEQYEVTEEEYNDWLKAMCLLILQPLDHGLNFLETLVKELMENTSLVKDFTVFSYDVDLADGGVLLCDRGIVLGNVDNNIRMEFFNLDSHNFVSFMFINYQAQQIVPVPSRALDAMKRYAEKTRVFNPRNDLVMLETYNSHCVWQAAEHVYCSRSTAHGINVS